MRQAKTPTGLKLLNLSKNIYYRQFESRKRKSLSVIGALIGNYKPGHSE